MTREWPPDVYGGAGVHIEHLGATLRSLPRWSRSPGPLLRGIAGAGHGGLPEVVDDGRTGLLVHYDPGDVGSFERGLAARMAEL